MLVDHLEHALVQTIRPIEHLPLPVKDEFLQVEGDGLRDTEVFCVLRDADLHLLANAEEMIYRMAACKNDGSVLGNIDLLLAEILGRYGLQPDEGMKRKLNIVLPG